MPYMMGPPPARISRHTVDADRPNPRYIDRANGAYFKGELDHVFANSPQWVTIYTWNEWFEETYIEPSVTYGDQYLQIAGSYLKPWVAQ